MFYVICRLIVQTSEQSGAINPPIPTTIQPVVSEATTDSTCKTVQVEDSTDSTSPRKTVQDKDVIKLWYIISCGDQMIDSVTGAEPVDPKDPVSPSIILLRGLGLNIH